MAESPKITPSENSLAKDLRLDRIVTWFMVMVVGVGVGAAGYTYKEMMSEFRNLSSAVFALNTNVAILKEKINDIEDLEREMISLRLMVHQLDLWRASQAGDRRPPGQ